MRKAISTSFVFGMLTLSASAPALAFTTTYLDTGYAATSFTTLSFDARAFAFDNSMNLFASSTADDNTGTIDISEFLRHPITPRAALHIHTPLSAALSLGWIFMGIN